MAVFHRQSADFGGHLYHIVQKWGTSDIGTSVTIVWDIDILNKSIVGLRLTCSQLLDETISEAVVSILHNTIFVKHYFIIFCLIYRKMNSQENYNHPEAVNRWRVV